MNYKSNNGKKMKDKKGPRTFYVNVKNLSSEEEDKALMKEFGEKIKYPSSITIKLHIGKNKDK